MNTAFMEAPINTPTGVDTTSDRSSSTLNIHTAYAYVTGLLVTFIGMKDQGSNTNPVKEHSAIMILFLIAMFVYVIALITFRAGNFNHSPILWLCLCHVSGALAVELLVLILFAPFWWLIINISSILLVVASFLCYHRHVSVLQYLKDIWSGQAGGGDHEMENMEASITIAA